MSSFAYTARDQFGAPSNGTLVAESVAEAARLLRAEGKYPTSVRSESGSGTAVGAGITPDSASNSGSGDIGPHGVKIPRADVVQIAMQLSIMLETGVTVSEALDCIAAQADKPNVKRLVDDLNRQVQNGIDFSASLARHPRSFPRLFVALIRASEKSGMLSKLINRATQYLRDEQEIIRRVRGALTYPAIMLAFACTTTVFLLTFVLPKFTAIYTAKQAALPVPTQILLALSSFVVTRWPLIVCTLAGTITGLILLLRTERGARAFYLVQLRLPLLGPIFRKLYLSRGLRMVGTMASAGVSLLDCVQTAHDLCANVYYRQLWHRVAEQIQAGKQLSEPLFQSPLVPRSVAQMLYSGEKSGKLAFVMEQVAGYSEDELKEKITELTRYIEPLMIGVMGIIIGGVALAMLLPIFTISRIVAR